MARSSDIIWKVLTIRSGHVKFCSYLSSGFKGEYIKYFVSSYLRIKIKNGSFENLKEFLFQVTIIRRIFDMSWFN